MILAQARSLAMTLVSLAAPAGPPGRRTRTGGKDGPWPVAWCGKGARIVTRARDLAHRGDVAGLGAVLAETPDLLGASFAAAIMQAAALAGRADVVRMLLDRGVGAGRPFWLPVAVTGQAFERVIFATPLCAARMKRRPAVEALLAAAGAREDVFTAAFLGDLTSLARMLAADPGLAQATDPAVDILVITPVDHAVAGRQPAALRLLLDQVADPVAGQVRALRGAVARGSLAMAELLLARGADATRIGTGRWVLNPELAPLLVAHGAAIDSSGSWIGASCTGNQNRKDDPEYVRALLRYGASANDRRAGDPDGATGVRALNATALHYAARAGFLRTIEVLLDHGADPHARDSQGRTPLDWLDQAAPSVSRTAVRDLLGLRIALLASPGSKDILVEDGGGSFVRPGGNGNGILDIVTSRAWTVAARVLEAIPCPAHPPERAECAHCRSELRGDGFLDGQVPATAGCPQPLRLEQARRALAQGVIGQLIGTSQISGHLGLGRGGKVAARILQHPAGDRMVGSYLLHLPRVDQFADTLTTRLPAHEAPSGARTETSGRRFTSVWNPSSAERHQSAERTVTLTSRARRAPAR